MSISATNTRVAAGKFRFDQISRNDFAGFLVLKPSNNDGKPVISLVTIREKIDFYAVQSRQLFQVSNKPSYPQFHVKIDSNKMISSFLEKIDVSDCSRRR